MRRAASLLAMLALTASLALLAAPAMAEFSLLGLKNSLVQFALRQVSVEGAFEITAEGVEEPRDGVTELVGIEISDAEGVWFRAEGLAVRWNAQRILLGELELNELTIRAPEVLRAPIPPEIEIRPDSEIASAEPPGLLDWPRAPITVIVEALRVERARIAAGVLAEQSLAFDATGAARDEGDIQALALTVQRTDETAGEIRLDYARDFAAETLRLDLQANEAAGGLVAELLGLPDDSASRVRLAADGPLTDWRLELDAETERVLSTTASAQIALTAPVRIEATARAVPGPALAPDIAAALGDAASLDLLVEEGQDGVIRIERGQIVSNAISARLEGAYRPAEGGIDAALDLAATPALAEAIAGLDLAALSFEGRVSGTLDALEARGALDLDRLATAPVDIREAALVVTARRSGPRLELLLDGALDGLRIDRIPASEIGRAALAGTLRFEDERLRIETLSLSSPLLTIAMTGDADFAGETAQVDYSVRAPRLGAVAQAYDIALDGAARASGTASGPFDAPQVDGFVEVTPLIGGETSYGTVRLDHAATLGAEPRGRATLSVGASPLGPARASLAFALSGRTLALNDIAAEAEGAALSGDVDLDVESGLAEGRIALEVARLERLTKLAGAPLGGALSVDAVLTPREGVQDARITATGTALAYDGARIGRLEAQGALNDLFGAIGAELRLSGSTVAAGGIAIAAIDGAASSPSLAALSEIRFDLSAQGLDAGAARFAQGRASGTAFLEGDGRIESTIALTDGAADDLRLDRVALDLAGPFSGLQATLAARGRHATLGEAALDAAAEADLLAEAPTIQVASLTGALGEARFALRAPMTIAMRPEGVAIDRLALSGPGFSLDGSAIIASEGLRAELTLDAPRLDALGEALDLPIERGAARFSATIDARPASPSGALQGSIDGLVLEGVDAADGTIGLRLSGAWDGRRAQLQGEATGPFGAPLRFSAATELRPAGLLPAPPPDAALEGALTWQGEIARIWELAPFPDHVLSGALDADLRVTGTLDAPRLAGRLSLSDGAYQNLELGTVLTEMSARSRLTDDGGMMIELTAQDGSGATVAAEARIAGDRLEASVTSRSAVLVRRDDATAALTLDIAARGPLLAPAITGDIRIDRAELRLIDASPPEVADLGPVEILGQPETARQDRDAASEGGPTLDISITAPDSIFVRGRGLDSEWRADLAVTGSAARPRVRGVVEKLRGRLDFIGQPFELETGRVVFQGGATIDPSLDVSLERERDNLLGRIRVVGRASTPEVRFESEPALPEDEVLPRVLFGRSQQSLSPDQAFQLASGLATLFSGGEGVLGRVRSAVGLDVLSVDQGENGYSVRAGRRLADGVFVGVRQPVDGSGASVEVEAEVFEGVTVDSEVQPQGGASFGLNYKFDF